MLDGERWRKLAISIRNSDFRQSEGSQFSPGRFELTSRPKVGASPANLWDVDGHPKSQNAFRQLRFVENSNRRVLFLRPNQEQRTSGDRIKMYETWVHLRDD